LLAVCLVCWRIGFDNKSSHEQMTVLDPSFTNLEERREEDVTECLRIAGSKFWITFGYFDDNWYCGFIEASWESPSLR
jgi:hypothetical protein